MSGFLWLRWCGATLILCIGLQRCGLLEHQDVFRVGLFAILCVLQAFFKYCVFVRLTLVFKRLSFLIIVLCNKFLINVLHVARVKLPVIQCFVCSSIYNKQ